MKNKKLLFGIGALVLVLVGGLVANSSGLLQGKVRNLRSPKSISTPSTLPSAPPPRSSMTSTSSSSDSSTPTPPPAEPPAEASAPAPTVDLLLNGSNTTLSFTTGNAAFGPGSLTLSWSSTDATSCSASTQNGGSSWVGSKATNGSHNLWNISGEGTIDFYLTCTNGNSSGSDSVSVNMTTAPAPTLDLLINGENGPVLINSGEEVVLSWTSTNAVSCQAVQGWTGSKPTSGSQTVTPNTASGGQYFRLDCPGAGGNAYDTVRANALTVDLKVNGSNGPLIAITGTGSSATGGGTVTLSWNAPNATACVASSSIETYGWTGSKPTSGSAVINVPSARQFSLNCLAPGIASVSDSVFVSTTIVSAPTVDLLINGEVGPVLINPGEEVVLSWTSTNALSCQATQGWSGVKTISGSQTVTPNTASGGQNFSLNCSGTAGSGYDTVRANALTVDLKANGSNGPVTATGSVATGGGTVTLSWNAPNATSATACVASSSIETVGWIGSKPTSGSAVINVPSARQFSLECLAPGVASVSDSVLVNVPE